MHRGNTSPKQPEENLLTKLGVLSLTRMMNTPYNPTIIRCAPSLLWALGCTADEITGAGPSSLVGGNGLRGGPVG